MVTSGGAVSTTVVLVNPRAGGGRAGKLWERWRREAKRLGSLAEHVADGATAALQAVRRAVEDECERIVVWGGDGTAHLVAGALLEVGAGARVTLGLVPAGTGSDLARAFAVPRRIAPALRRALHGAPHPCDAGRCDGRRASFYFANIASAGLSGMVDEQVNAQPERGATAFLGATLRAIRCYRPVPARVEVDGAPWFEGDLLLLAVANGTTFGKGMRVAPGADPGDGMFDVVAVRGMSRLQLVRELPRLYLGRHLGAAPVRHIRGRQVRLLPSGPLPPFDADGETYASGEALFTVLPAALRIAGATPA